MDERPATIKELNQLQVDLLERIFEGQAELTQAVNDFNTGLTQRIQALETARDEQIHEEVIGLGMRGQLVMVCGILASSALSVLSLAIALWRH